MKFTGRLKEPVTNLSGKMAAVIEINEDFLQCYDELKDCEKLSLEIKRYREKRSLNANAYFHVLNSKIADKLRISNSRCKNILIGRYGQPELIEDGKQAVLKTNISVEQMMEQESLHCMPCGGKEENGIEVNFFRVYRGSHTYNTEEMSRLIDGAIQEAKDIGIPDAEIATPDEKRLLEEKYGVRL